MLRFSGLSEHVARSRVWITSCKVAALGKATLPKYAMRDDCSSSSPCV